jgi:hypothetical protein
LQAVKAGKFEDRYENALVELLNKKRKGEPVRTAVKPRDTGNVFNPMDALRKSQRTNSVWDPLASVKEGEVSMAQKANLTPADKYESDRREAERLHLDKYARLEAGLTDPVSAIQPAPTAEHPHREGLSFWQAVKTMFK